MTPFGVQLNVADLDGQNGFIIDGLNGRDQLGRVVSSAGDINNDGIRDFVISAQGASPNGVSQAGQTYVVFGGNNVGNNGRLDLTTLDGRNGFVINGIGPSHASGSAVSNAGDVNGDGIDDLIIGAPTATISDSNRLNEGQSYVVFGHEQVGGSGTLNLSSLNGLNGFAINGVDPSDFSGTSVSSAGDVNGDGLADLVIGAPFAESSDRLSHGESYVVFGHPELGRSGDFNLANLDSDRGLVITGVDFNERSGMTVSDIGDINQDGITDLLIGAPNATFPGRQSAGKAYVVFGSTTLGDDLDLSTLDGRNGFVIEGLDQLDRLGSAVSRAGDVNNDGVADFVIGAPTAQVDTRGTVGEAYVIFGHPTIGNRGRLDLSELDGRNGFVIPGINNSDKLGTSVSGAGDINNDGIDDLLLGANDADPTGISIGQAYVIFGGDTVGNAGRLELTTLNGTNGFTINGVNSLDRLGESVSTLGDINQDGIDDLIVSAPSAPGLRNPGKSYVIFGFQGNNVPTNPINPPTPSPPITPPTPSPPITPPTPSPPTTPPTIPPIAPEPDPNPHRGTAGADRFQGTNGRDVFRGLGGRDRLIGKGGKDILLGGSGDDVVNGGAGNDRLRGNGGRDRLFGKAGNDNMNGGSGNDILDGGPGTDVLKGGSGSDIFVLRRGRGLSRIKDFTQQDEFRLKGNIKQSDLTFSARGNGILISVGNDDLAMVQGIQPELLTTALFYSGVQTH